MRIFLALFISFSISIPANAQLYDMVEKSPDNIGDRTVMLDLLRAELFREFGQEFIFVVKHFTSDSQYAWFMGNAQRKDGKPVRFSDPGSYDCCHVEALFRKTRGRWTLVEHGAFATDAWWQGISYRYPQATKGIFGNIR